MTAKKLILVIVGAALVSVIAVIILRLLGMTNAAVIGGGVAGGITGALGASYVGGQKDSAPHG